MRLIKRHVLRQHQKGDERLGADQQSPLDLLGKPPEGRLAIPGEVCHPRGQRKKTLSREAQLDFTLEWKYSIIYAVSEMSY